MDIMPLQIHKRTKLTLEQQKEIFSRRYKNNVRTAVIAKEYHVSRPTIYKILTRGRKRDYACITGSDKKSHALQCNRTNFSVFL